MEYDTVMRKYAGITAEYRFIGHLACALWQAWTAAKELKDRGERTGGCLPLWAMSMEVDEMPKLLARLRSRQCWYMQYLYPLHAEYVEMVNEFEEWHTACVKDRLEHGVGEYKINDLGNSDPFF